MKARIILASIDEDQKEQCERLGLPEPDATEDYYDFYFRLEYIEVAYLNGDGAIVLYYGCTHWLVEYDEQVWNKIKYYLESK